MCVHVGVVVVCLREHPLNARQPHIDCLEHKHVKCMPLTLTKSITNNCTYNNCEIVLTSLPTWTCTECRSNQIQLWSLHFPVCNGKVFGAGVWCSGVDRPLCQVGAKWKNLPDFCLFFPIFLLFSQFFPLFSSLSLFTPNLSIFLLIFAIFFTVRGHSAPYCNTDYATGLGYMDGLLCTICLFQIISTNNDIQYEIDLNFLAWNPFHVKEQMLEVIFLMLHTLWRKNITG